jgi:hypothetical protein
MIRLQRYSRMAYRIWILVVVIFQVDPVLQELRHCCSIEDWPANLFGTLTTISAAVIFAMFFIMLPGAIFWAVTGRRPQI